MRFTAVLPSVLLVTLLALTNVVVAVSQVKSNVVLTSDNVEAELMYEYFEKRVDEVASNSTGVNSLAAPEASGSSVEPVATAIATATKSGHGSSAAASATAAKSTSTATAKKAKAPSSFASIPILTRGDLFYLGVAVTLFLWCTGKAIDVKLERQEKYAQSQIHSI